MACMHATSMYCGSQLAAVAHRIHSNCNKNFASRRSLEKLYGSTPGLGNLLKTLSSGLTSESPSQDLPWSEEPHRPEPTPEHGFLLSPQTIL